MKKILLIILVLMVSCSHTIPRSSGIVETWNGNLYDFSQANLNISDDEIVIDKRNGEKIAVKTKEIKIIRIIHDYKGN